MNNIFTTRLDKIYKCLAKNSYDGLYITNLTNIRYLTGFTGSAGLLIILKNTSGINRQKLQIFLEKRGIQTRTIFTGNILRQPIMKKKVYKKVKNAEVNSNNIMKNGILIGCHHGLKNIDINFIIKNLKEFIHEI